jgi:hypothetical protein
MSNDIIVSIILKKLKNIYNFMNKDKKRGYINKKTYKIIKIPLYKFAYK